jgi:hypothetical protein
MRAIIQLNAHVTSFVKKAKCLVELHKQKRYLANNLNSDKHLFPFPSLRPLVVKELQTETCFLLPKYQEFSSFFPVVIVKKSGTPLPY